MDIVYSKQKKLKKMFLEEDKKDQYRRNKWLVGTSCNNSNKISYTSNMSTSSLLLLVPSREARSRAVSATYCLAILALGLVSTTTTLGYQLGAEQIPPDSPSSSLHPLAPVQQIIVNPNQAIRIECKLPRLDSNSQRSYYWNFQRTATSSSKSPLLFFEEKNLDDSLGVQLFTERSIGTYDLIINNATYELNDGIYNCEYRDTTPETRQRISREYRLTVLIPPQPPTIVSRTQAPAREGQEYQLSCQTQGGNPEPNITWYRNNQEILPGTPAIRLEQIRFNESTTNTLTWIPTIDDYHAVYKCTVANIAMGSMQPYEREFKLELEYAPRINVGPYNPLKVLNGAQVTLPCHVDANPPVKGVRWYKDGHLISNQYNHTINEAKISDSGVYSCQADNGMAPLVGPSSVVSLGLHGQVVGPASNFFSLFGMGQSSNGNNPNDNSPKSAPVEVHLHLQVLYPPRVQVKPSKVQQLNEGDFFSLNCSVDSSPLAHEFIWTKQEDPGFRRVFSAPISSLDFQAVTANDMGNYTCTAVNRLDPSGYSHIDRQASASAQVQVRHKPGMAEISIGQAGETELGAKTLIQCRAKPPGYPEPVYKFWRHQGANGNLKYVSLGRPATHDSTYTIQSAKPDDEAKYGCVASNEMGTSSEADGDLIVNEAPIIIHDSTRRSVDARPQGDYPYSITVRASGKPEPKVSWFHRSPIDGRRIELSSIEMQSRFRIETTTKPEQNQMRPKYNVVSTLYFKTPLEVDDRGLYSVEFNNGLSRTAIEDFKLHINHSPIPAPRNQPIFATPPGSQQSPSNTRTKAGFDLGESVNLTCRVSAYPRPEFVWEGPGEKTIETNSRYTTMVTNPRDDIWESTLTFPQAQEADYGDYMCSATNDQSRPMGNGETSDVRMFIELSRKTIPDKPVQLEATDATQDSITLQWIPGFDGGFTLNQYIVQYSVDDGSGQTLGKRFPNADSLGVVMATSGANNYNNNNLLDQIDGQQAVNSVMASNYPKLYDCLSTNPCTINHLLPRQAYVFRLRAKNELGFSDYTDELRAMTRANMSQIPKISDASFDTSRNILHFRIESASDYLLNNLNARIEVRPFGIAQTTTTTNNNQQQQPEVQEISAQQQLANPTSTSTPTDWRLHTTVPIRQERAEAYLNMQPDMEQLRITLCSRSNESLCGPEYVVSMKSAASLFLHDQRGFSISILMSTVMLIVVLAGFATTIHSCCLSRKKNKKADTIERVEGSIDNKPISHQNGSTNTGGNAHKLSHGSTTSTNSTSATASTTNGANGLQSMDSINGGSGLNGAGGGGSASDHSSDHSRQAKLDSMLPPNYNHYADRASIMMEQQQLMQQQQGLMSDHKLGSPFGLPNSALLSVANQHQQQQNSPMLNGSGLSHFTYGQTSQHMLDAQQHSMQSLEHQHHMMDANIMLGSSGLVDPADGQQQQMWPNHHQLVDDYNYNALGYGSQAAQQQSQDQMIDPTYGTTGSVMMSQQSAAYDNNANSGQFQSYMSAYQQQELSPSAAYQQAHSQYQQEIAVAQQQMYGTLTRNGYSNANNNNNDIINNKSSNNSSNQQQLEHQQQQQQQQYSTTTNGLIQPPQIIAPPVISNQESDYGTTGGRNGRLIREIIV